MTALTDQLQYNTEREHLIIPEYGRHLQKMINHAVAQDTKEERNRLSKSYYFNNGKYAASFTRCC